MAGAFLKILFGLLIVAVDVTLDVTSTRFDVLFDVVGYALMFAGCATLETQSREFSTAKSFVAGSAILWCARALDIAPLEPLLESGLRVCDVLTMWFVCSGVIRMAVDREQTALAHTATSVRLWGLIIGVGAWLIGPLALVAPPLGVALAVPVMILGFTVLFAVMVVLGQASVRLA